VARKLGVPSMYLVINKAPEAWDFNAMKALVEEKYNCDVAAILPHSDQMMMLASSGIFALLYPEHPISAKYKQIAQMLIQA
jgi:septum site-determining protein MinD